MQYILLILKKSHGQIVNGSASIMTGSKGMNQGIQHIFTVTTAMQTLGACIPSELAAVSH